MSAHGSSRRGWRLLIAASLAGTVLAFAPSSPVSAKTFVVTTTADGGKGSLRRAVARANASPGADTIVLGRGETYPLTCDGGGQLRSTGPLTIVGKFSTIRQECAQNRVLDQSSRRPLTLKTVTIRGGEAVAGQGNGGGVRAGGSVKLIRTRVLGNSAQGSGGGVFAQGSITMRRSAVVANFAGPDGNGGSGLWMNDPDGRIRMIDSSVNRNRSRTGTPYGGIYSQGEMFLVDSRVDRNRSAFGVAGIFSYGDLSLVSSSVDENEATSTSGVVMTNGASALLVDSTVDGNSVGSDGAGVQLNTGGGQTPSGRLVMIRSSVSDNLAQGAAGIDVRDGTDIELYGSSVVNNQALVASADPDLAGIGAQDGDITLVETSVTDNLADEGSLVGVGTQTGNIRVVRSTVANNSAGADMSGVSSASGRVVVSNSTVVDNLAEDGQAGVVAARAVLRYATVAENQGTVASAVAADRLASFGSVMAPASLGGPLCVVTTTVTRGYNYEQGSDTCGFGGGAGDVVNGADAQLGALADNGGPTETRAPASTSPLLDVIPRKADECRGTDQRGVSRPQMSGCDIGAVEFTRRPVS